MRRLVLTLVLLVACGGEVPVYILREEPGDRELLEEAFGIWGLTPDFLRHEQVPLRPNTVFVRLQDGYLDSGARGTSDEIYHTCLSRIRSARLPRTLAHEVGHVLKVGHRDEPGALMEPGGGGWEISEREWEIAQGRIDNCYR